MTKTDFEPFEPFEAPDVGEVVGFNGGVVVVGAGIAGWSVVRAIRSIDATIPILMITLARETIITSLNYLSLSDKTPIGRH